MNLHKDPLGNPLRTPQIRQVGDVNSIVPEMTVQVYVQSEVPICQYFIFSPDLDRKQQSRTVANTGRCCHTLIVQLLNIHPLLSDTAAISISIAGKYKWACSNIKELLCSAGISISISQLQESMDTRRIRSVHW